MNTKKRDIVLFLKELLACRRRLPSQLASDLGISHATVSRWLSGKDTPSIKSCHKLAEYSGVPLERILNLTGHLPSIARQAPAGWPEFREYARHKYREELDDDLIVMIEDLIERRRQRNHNKAHSEMGI